MSSGCVVHVFGFWRQKEAPTTSVHLKRSVFCDTSVGFSIWVDVSLCRVVLVCLWSVSSRVRLCVSGWLSVLLVFAGINHCVTEESRT